MSNLNSHIEAYLDEYRGMNDADFAVMITGSWGCGKTWFVKNYLKQKCIVNGKNEYVYISLNGISNTSDIDMAIFQAVHPVLGSKAMVTLGKVLKASIKAGIKLDMDITGDKTPDMATDFDPGQGLSACDFSIKSKSKLLIFDDLERCLLNPAEILGYVNAFVESRESKVILVGEEGWLAENDKEAHYGIIKEKVVGKTFKITETIEDIIGSLIQKINYPITFDIIERNKSQVICIFKKVATETESYNYRALKHSLRDFEYFFGFVESKYRDNTVFVNELFSIFLSLNYALQLGHCKIDTMTFAPSRDKEPASKERTKIPFETILKRHGIAYSTWAPELGGLIFPLSLWKDIFSNCHVNKEIISKAISNTKYFIAKSHSEWRKLWYWQALSDSEADDALEKVKVKISNAEYTEMDEILHVYAILLGLAKLRAIPNTETDVITDARRYLDRLKKEGKLLSFQGVPPWTPGSAAYGLGYWGEPDEKSRFRELSKMMMSFIEASWEHEVSEGLKKWKSSDNASFLCICEKLKSPEVFHSRPVLHLLSYKEFVASYLAMPSDSKGWLIAVLENRYSSNRVNLKKELSFLKGCISEFRKKFKSYSHATPTSHQIKLTLKKFILFQKMLGK